MPKLSKSIKFVLIMLTISLAITICFGVYRISIGCPGMFRDCYLEGADAFWVVDYIFRLLNILLITYLLVVIFVHGLAKALKILIGLFLKR